MRGDFERRTRFNDENFGRGLSPIDGYPIPGMLSVSVVADSCLEACGASSVARLKTEKAAISWLENLGLALDGLSTVSFAVMGRWHQNKCTKPPGSAVDAFPVAQQTLPANPLNSNTYRIAPGASSISMPPAAACCKICFIDLTASGARPAICCASLSVICPLWAGSTRWSRKPISSIASALNLL